MKKVVIFVLLLLFLTPLVAAEEISIGEGIITCNPFEHICVDDVLMMCNEYGDEKIRRLKNKFLINLLGEALAPVKRLKGSYLGFPRNKVQPRP